MVASEKSITQHFDIGHKKGLLQLHCSSTVLYCIGGGKSGKNCKTLQFISNVGSNLQYMLRGQDNHGILVSCIQVFLLFHLLDIKPPFHTLKNRKYCKFYQNLDKTFKSFIILGPETPPPIL